MGSCSVVAALICQVDAAVAARRVSRTRECLTSLSEESTPPCHFAFDAQMRAEGEGFGRLLLQTLVQYMAICTCVSQTSHETLWDVENWTRFDTIHRAFSFSLLVKLCDAFF